MTDNTVTVEGASDAPKVNPLAGQLAGKTGTTEGYEGFDAKPAVTDDTLAALRSLAQELINYQRQLATAEAAVVAARELLAGVQEKKLPDMMERHGLPRFDFVDKTTGEKMIMEFISDKWRVAMPPKQGKTADPQWRTKHSAIYEWIETIGKGSAIKRDMLVPLGLMKDEDAAKVADAFKKEHPDLDVALSKYVEAATLTAMVSKLKNAGENVSEHLKVTPIREVRVKGS